jgi:hypothetical protein
MTPATTVKKTSRRGRGPLIFLNHRQEVFAQLVATGVPRSQAYTQAGYKPSPFHANRLANFGLIKAKIQELRASQKAKAEFTRDDLRKWLIAAITTPVDEINAKSPLCQEVITMTRNGRTMNRMRAVSKLEAAKQLATLCGWNAPDRRELEITGGIVISAEIQDRFNRIFGQPIVNEPLALEG